MSHQTPLVLISIDYEKVFNSVDRRAKFLFLYGIPDKYTKVISAMYENSTAVVKVEMRLAASFILNLTIILESDIEPRASQSCYLKYDE